MKAGASEHFKASLIYMMMLKKTSVEAGVYAFMLVQQGLHQYCLFQLSNYNSCRSQPMLEQLMILLLFLCWKKAKHTWFCRQFPCLCWTRNITIKNKTFQAQMQLIPAELLEEMMPAFWAAWTTLSEALMPGLHALLRLETLSHSRRFYVSKKHQPLDLSQA